MKGQEQLFIWEKVRRCIGVNYIEISKSKWRLDTSQGWALLVTVVSSLDTTPQNITGTEQILESESPAGSIVKIQVFELLYIDNNVSNLGRKKRGEKRVDEGSTGKYQYEGKKEKELEKRVTDGDEQNNADKMVKESRELTV